MLKKPLSAGRGRGFWGKGPKHPQKFSKEKWKAEPEGFPSDGGKRKREKLLPSFEPSSTVKSSNLSKVSNGKKPKGAMVPEVAIPIFQRKDQ